MPTSMLKKFYDFVDGLSIMITPRITKDLDQEYYRGTYSSRLNVDSLILERWLIHEEIVKPPMHRGHDIRIGKCKIDLKEIVTFHSIKKNENGSGGLPWFQLCVEEGHLTHFFMYQTDRPRDRILEQGEVICFKSIELVNARYYLNNRIEKSKFEGFYGIPKCGMVTA